MHRFPFLRFGGGGFDSPYEEGRWFETWDAASCQRFFWCPSRPAVQVQHENLVKFYGVCIDMPPLRIITEFCDLAMMSL